jgi:hypothetical protein
MPQLTRRGGKLLKFGSQIYSTLFIDMKGLLVKNTYGNWPLAEVFSIPLQGAYPPGLPLDHSLPEKITRLKTTPIVFFMQDRSISMDSSIPIEPFEFNPSLRQKVDDLIQFILIPHVENVLVDATWKRAELHIPFQGQQAEPIGPEERWLSPAVFPTWTPTDDPYLNWTGGDVLFMVFINEASSVSGAGENYYDFVDSLSGTYTPHAPIFSDVNLLLPPGSVEAYTNARTFKMIVHRLPIRKVVGFPEQDDFQYVESEVFEQHMNDVINATGLHAGQPRPADFGVSVVQTSGASLLTIEAGNILAELDAWFAGLPPIGTFPEDGEPLP